MTLRRSLGTVALAAVMFFNTSGGAFSMEGLVEAVGPGATLLLLVVVPLLWSIPETLLVAELASMLPEEGGYYRWVHRAFGPFWAFQNGWCTWCYSLVDMAIYPVLLNQYLRFFFPDLSAGAQWAVALAMIWTATAINLRGAGRVGQVSMAAAAVVLGTFLAISVAAVPRMDHLPWEPFTRPGETTAGALGVGLSTVLWNYLGWDNASTVGEEIRDASRTYPRALALTLAVVTLGYLVPVSAALAASDWTQWRDGGWPAIAVATGGALGPALAVLVAAAGVVSALALFNALLLAYSRIPLAMARDGLLPGGLAVLDRRDNPARAVLLSAVCYSVFALLPFAQLVVADVLLYSLALGMEYAALWWLRATMAAPAGAFRVPVGRAGLAVLMAVPAVILLVTVALNLTDGSASAPAALGALAAAALGPVVYWQRVRRGRALGRQA
ncbi:MAG: APC family permease [Gemmatimonadetes bacterium]|nr:APC family permease [Gemmatimonadota bacterium]